MSLSKWKLPAAFANWRLARQLRRAGGLAHVHGPLFYAALRHGLRWAGVIRVVHVHLDEGVDGLRWAFREPPELIITCARFLVDQVERSLPEGSRTRVVAVPNAVDTDRFQPGPAAEAKAKLGAPADRPLALMLANLAPHKGQETAVRAVAALKQRGTDVNLWLAGAERGGAGAFTQRLTSLIRDAGVEDRVRLLGQRGDAPDLLRAADFFLLPSTHEGLPLSVLEAQAAGVPVLAAPTAGVPEVVRDGETGFLIPAGDADGYARRMQQLLGAPELKHRMTEAALEQVRRAHTWPAYCARIEALYEELREVPRVAG